MKQLHILNGEGTAHNFSLSGDYLVWNEALACGNTLYEVASPKFYASRQAFFQQQHAQLPLREPAPNDTYQNLVVAQLDKLKNAQEYDEITLWFEFDWFCQVNLMAALSWFAQQKHQFDNICLVCIDAHPAVEDFRGLGQLMPEHFAPLFDQRSQLTTQDLAFADKVWKGYCSNDMLVLADLIASDTPPAFPYLTTAFGYFQQLFPASSNGLNLIEQHMLTIAQNHSLKNKHQWVGQALREGLPHLGFGDLQYYEAIQRMEALWQEDEHLQLTDLGKQVALQQANFLQVQPDKFALGGVFNTDYRWQSNEGKLVSNK